MKVKTSVTLSKATLAAVDKLVGKAGNRSAFIELAVREYLVAKQREARDARDIELINKHADELNALMEEVMKDQIPIDYEDET